MHSPSAVEDDQYFSEVSFQFQPCLFPLSTSRIRDELPLDLSLLKHVHTWTCSGRISVDTRSVMRPIPILPPRLTQLGQQTTLYNSPNYPAGPCLVQLPQRAMLIYNVTGSSISTLHCPHTYKFHSTGKHAFLHMCVCLAGDCVSAGLVLPQSLSPAAMYPS